MKRILLVMLLVLVGVSFMGCAMHRMKHVLPPGPPLLYEHYYHLVPKDTSIEEMNKVFERMKGWELPLEIGTPAPELNAYLLHFRRPIMEEPRTARPPAEKVQKPAKTTPAKKAKKDKPALSPWEKPFQPAPKKPLAP